VGSDLSHSPPPPQQWSKVGEGWHPGSHLVIVWRPQSPGPTLCPLGSAQEMRIPLAKPTVHPQTPTLEEDGGKPSMTDGSTRLINNSPCRYSKTPLNENLTVAPCTETTLEEGPGWNPDLTSELEPSQGMRWRCAVPIGAQRGYARLGAFQEL
jgi:hypothetical protein